MNDAAAAAIGALEIVRCVGVGGGRRLRFELVHRRGMSAAPSESTDNEPRNRSLARLFARSLARPHDSIDRLRRERATSQRHTSARAPARANRRRSFVAAVVSATRPLFLANPTIAGVWPPIANWRAHISSFLFGASIDE